MINSVVLVGRITQDVILKKSKEGKSFANFTLAINRLGDGAGADYINCVAFGKSAEYLEQYVKKGYLVGVCGSIKTGSYENSQGQKVYTTQIMCSSVNNYTPRSNGSNGAESSGSQSTNNNVDDAPMPIQQMPDYAQGSSFTNELNINPDDLPF